MHKKKYIIKKYKSYDNYYIYESNSSSILKVDEVIYNLIYGLLNYSAKEFVERYEMNSNYDSTTLVNVYNKFLPIREQLFINT
ncbi:MAG: hypothetical protein KKD38_03920 [Candidatus Delongbacteria bacterium]|nr:hypothetical protein [Candidatus Delongbacteria bacterium]MCG2759712.1 hypothetical protein [Candidatus Delongbacteria bacterium]